MDKLILIGSGGNFKVVFDLIRDCYEILGVTDCDVKKIGKDYYGCKVLGDDSLLTELYKKEVNKAVITIGSLPGRYLRKRLYNYLKEIGYTLPNVVSKNSIISQSVTMGDSNIIMDLSVLHADVSIGSNCIINTGSIIEHDCVIGDNVHIAPGAKLAGAVKVGDGSHIGIGATIIQSITIGENCIIGAGTVVLNDVPDNTTVVGVPAKPIKSTTGEENYGSR